MIPNRIHFIFGLDPYFGGKPFSLIHYLAIRSAAVVNRPDEIVLHYSYQPTGQWWEAARRFMTPAKMSFPEIASSSHVSHFAHKSDILRLQILQKEGGIYLDADTFCINSFEPLRKYETVMGIEPNTGLCNATILAEPNSKFIRRWISEYDKFDERIWNYHSVQLPYKLARGDPASIHVEEQHSFFFPTYDDPMYLWLWSNYLETGHRFHAMATLARNCPLYFSNEGPLRISAYLRHILSSRGSYYRRLKKSYCVHLWESLWWDKHLKNLDAADIRKSTGLFARLILDIIPDFDTI